jgi:HPt (histidine-containing phosphotransfer) domain-containing protein
MAEISRLAHSLKSSSASLGAIDLSSRCQLIEAATRNHERPGDIGSQIEALTLAFQTARRELLDLVER